MAKKKQRARRTAIVPRVVFAVAASACVVPSLVGCGSTQQQQSQVAPLPPLPPPTTRYEVVTDQVEAADAGTTTQVPGVAAYRDDHQWELMGVAARPDDYQLLGVAVQSP